MKKHITYLTLLALFIPQLANAADDKMDIPVDPRIKILTYNESDVYTLGTKPGFQTSINFARNEEINTISVGDRSPWQIVPSGNRIFIRPLVDGVETNMTVITNLREYHFDIKAVGEKQTNNIYVAQFRYPHEEKSATEETLNDMESPARPAPVKTPAPVVLTPAPATAPTPQLASRAPEPETAAPAPAGDTVSIAPLDTQRTKSLNTDYTYTGPDEVAPNQVYDDGRNTYIVYDKMPSPKPKPFITSADGKMVLANHRVVKNKLILLTVTKNFMIKSAGGDISVYNESIKVQP